MNCNLAQPRSQEMISTQEAPATSGSFFVYRPTPFTERRCYYPCPFSEETQHLRRLRNVLKLFNGPNQPEWVLTCAPANLPPAPSETWEGTRRQGTVDRQNLLIPAWRAARQGSRTMVLDSWLGALPRPCHTFRFITELLRSAGLLCLVSPSQLWTGWSGPICK